jgi:uncharacterized membrane protein
MIISSILKYLLNATTLGLAGFIALTVVGGISVLVGLGFFTAGVVQTCSIAEHDDVLNTVTYR